MASESGAYNENIILNIWQIRCLPLLAKLNGYECYIGNRRKGQAKKQSIYLICYYDNITFEISCNTWKECYEKLQHRVFKMDPDPVDNEQIFLVE